MPRAQIGLAKNSRVIGLSYRSTSDEGATSGQNLPLEDLVSGSFKEQVSRAGLSFTHGQRRSVGSASPQALSIQRRAEGVHRRHLPRVSRMSACRLVTVLCAPSVQRLLCRLQKGNDVSPEIQVLKFPVVIDFVDNTFPAECSEGARNPSGRDFWFTCGIGHSPSHYFRRK